MSFYLAYACVFKTRRLYIAVWQIVEGLGAQRLCQVSEEVEEWNRWGQDLPALKERSDVVGQLAAITANKIIDGWLAGNTRPDIEGLALDQETSVNNLFAQAALAKTAHQRVDELRRGLSFNDIGKKARMRVIGAGVLRSTGFVEPGYGVDIRSKFKPLEPGMVLEGKIEQFNAKPRLGGALTLLNHVGIATVVHGLVDPLNGLPQVELEILKKVKKR